MAHQALLNKVDALVSMLDKSKGDVADILQNVYWQREGRESVDAVLIVGALIGLAAAGRGLFVAMARDVATIWRDLRGAGS